MEKVMSGRIFTGLAAAIILAVTLYAAQRPYANWDLFPYLALTISAGDPPEQIHRRTYQLASGFLAPDDFENAARRQPALRKDPIEFNKVLPYFSIKPGFIATMKLLVMAGVHPVLATYLPSLIAYCLLGWLLLWWLPKYMPDWVGSLLALGLLALPCMTDSARYSSPDMMSGFLFVAGTILIFSGRSAGIWMVVLSCTFRPDAMLAGAVLLVVAAVTAKLRVRQAVIGGAVMLLAVVIILWNGPGLQHFLFTTSDYASGWGPAKYLRSYVDGFQAGAASALHSWLPLFFLTGCVSVYIGAQDSSDKFWRLLSLGLLGILVLRYGLHPVVEDRMLVGIYVALALGLVHLLSKRLRHT